MIEKSEEKIKHLLRKLNDYYIEDNYYFFDKNDVCRLATDLIICKNILDDCLKLIPEHLENIEEWKEL